MAEHFDVIVFGAHPDDGEMVIGGTMIKLVKAGHKLKYVCLTQGEMGTYGDPATRKKEFKRACKVMGCSGELLDFPDTRVENTPDGRIRLARIIREHKPKVVFAPYHSNPYGEMLGVSNVDHYATGGLVRDAVKMARLQKTIPDLPKHQIQKLYFYMLPRDVHATIYVDVSDVIDQTVEAISAYASQMQIRSHGQDIKKVLLLRRQSAGIDIGVEYAERLTTELPLSFKPQTYFEL